MLEIALICEYPTVLGGERSMLAVAEKLRGGRVRFHAIVPAGKLADAWLELGAKVTASSAGRNGDPAIRRQSAAAELHAILKAQRPDVLHANSLAMGRMVGPTAREIGIPSIAHLRDIVRQSRSAIEQLSQNTRLLAVSEAVRQFHVSAGLAPAQVQVLHNGVDLNHFRPQSPRGHLHAQLQLPREMLLVGAIGQISLRKGWDVLLAAATQVIEQTENVAFVLIGACYSDKPETREVEHQIRQATEQFPGRVFWLGERDDVAALLVEFTILAHAARQEPLGRVLLEAAAAGLPIVATDVGGTTEIFPPSARAAVLIPPNDPHVLAAALLKLAADPTLRSELGKSSRRRAEQAFDIEQSALGLLRHYEEVAALR